MYNRPLLMISHVLTNGMGWCGVALILYGIAVQLTGERWQPIEWIIAPTTSTLTLVATGLTAASIYLPTKPPPPNPLSKFVTAPVAIGACATTLVLSVWMSIPQVIIGGFAIVGLAGALFRLGLAGTMMSDEAPSK